MQKWIKDHKICCSSLTIITFKKILHFSLNLLFLIQKPIWFCILKLEIPQPILPYLALPSQTSTNGSVTSFLSYNLAIQESISGRFLAENIHSRNCPWRNTTSDSSEFSRLFILPIFELTDTVYFDLEMKQKHTATVYHSTKPSWNRVKLHCTAKVSCLFFVHNL